MGRAPLYAAALHATRRLVHLALGALALTVLATSCAPGKASPSAPPPTSTTVVARHADQIRLGLVGEVSSANTWALFDSKGYSYNNYALRSAYWPRLYALSIPSQAFEPVAAIGMPEAIHQEGVFYTGTVGLRPDLRWTDGSPFTAEDVAFTVNTAIEFRLEFDWQDHYDWEWLDHAEAVRPDLVKFFYGRAPGVEAWQYGVLQGPVVQRGFWSSRVAAAAQLLPQNDVLAHIAALKGSIAALEMQINALYASSLNAQGEQARQLQADIRRAQGNLDKATNDLAKAETGFDEDMNDARTALFELDDDGEPHAGRWIPGGHPSIPGETPWFENKANPDFPGAAPRFDRALYYTYPTHEAALAALENGEVDVILNPTASTPEPGQAAMTSPTRSLRFLVFNLASPPFNDEALRRALACLVDQRQLAAGSESRAAPLASFVAPGEAFWHDSEAELPCSALDADGRLEQAVDMLKAKGYAWKREPTEQRAGERLLGPDGKPLGSLDLLTPADDDVRAAAASYVEHQALQLGLDVRAQAVATDLIDYEVFSSQRYDMAVLGWKASTYPGYLCQWFGAGGPFQYDASRLTSVCRELKVTSDLEAAHGEVRTIQKILAEDVPMVPLLSAITTDNYRNVSYPFESWLDGLSSIYGAPELAIPAAP